MTFARPIVAAAALLAFAGTAMAAEVNIYNGRHYTTDNAIYETFTRQTGIKVNIIEGDASQLIQRIKTEGANSPADITGSSPPGSDDRWSAAAGGAPRKRIISASMPARAISGPGHGSVRR